jgi:hypothetical protein
MIDLLEGNIFLEGIDVGMSGIIIGDRITL